MPTNDLRDLRIIYADDNLHMHKIVKTILRTMGIEQVRYCTGPEDALKEIQDFRPDLLITDWEMEPFDGLELVRRIRGSADPCTAGLPVILLTAHTNRKVIAHAQKAGVNEILAKPISVKLLHSRLVRITEKFGRRDPGGEASPGPAEPGADVAEASGTDG